MFSWVALKLHFRKLQALYDIETRGDGRGGGAATSTWHKIFAGVYFCGLAIFLFLQELIFAIKTD